jgi:iron uptake system EfeUOB component EfeO/EfeM
MIFNVVEAAEDDDGVSASKVEKAKSQAQLAWEETWNALSEDQRVILTEFSQEIIQILASGDAESARDTIATKGLDGDEMYALYGLFNKEARKVLGRAVFTKRKS